MQKNSPTVKGFTLIEVLVAIALVGILAAIALPSYLNRVKQARYAEANLIMGAIATDLQVYQAENGGDYPVDPIRNTAPEGISSFPVAPNADTPWKVFDIDNYVRGDEQSADCERWVQVVFLGENGEREAPININDLDALGVQLGVINKVEDDRVLVVYKGVCNPTE